MTWRWTAFDIVRTRGALLWVGLTLLAGCATTPAPVLPAPVRAALAQAEVPAEALAAVAIPLAPFGPAATAWSWRGHEPVQPASTMKLVTSIVALDTLGPNHRGDTELRSAAPVLGQTLQGPLVIKGGADPELGIPELWALLLELRESGVCHLDGDIWLDRSLFHPPRIDQGLPPFDEAPAFPYNVIPDALHLAGSLLPLELQATAEGVRVRSLPALDGLEIKSALRLNDRPCTEWSREWAPAVVETLPEGGVRVTLHGAFPRGCTQRTRLQVLDRDQLAELLLRTLWRQVGGSWHGRVQARPAPPDSRVLARRVSRPWGEHLRQVNKASDNALTRLLYLQLGLAEPATEPPRDSLERSATVVRRWLARHGIDDTGLVLDNGSGLSRRARISPWQLAQMLAVASRGRYAPELLMSLPLAGEDGGLRNRLRDSPAAGQARLKTGSLRNVVALAGYLQGPDGRGWAVAMMINHERALAARPALDALVDALARFGPEAWDGAR